MQPKDKLDRIYKTLMIIALVITGVILLKDIVIPVAFAALISVVLLPVVRKLERTTGRILSILITLMASLVLMGLIIWFVVSQVTSLVASLPDLEQKFYELVNQASEGLRETFNISTDEQSKYLSDGIREMSRSLTGILLSTSYLAYFIVQVPIYIFLFLLYREKFKVFILSFTAGDELLWQKDVEGVIQGYIQGLAIVIVITGTMISIGLLLLGIQHAVFFGFLSGTLVMIPYIGIGMGATLPFLVALVTKDSAWYAVGVIAVHAFVQFLEGNFITPKITASRISVNAIAAIVALLIGEKILGIPGMILAIPAVGTLRILLTYTKTMKPFAALLEGSTNKAKEHH
jgi:predicted PurR-regulated permease PerM